MKGFPRTHPTLNDAYDEMAAQSTVPLWEVYKHLVAMEPAPTAVAHRWRYEELRPLLLGAGAAISADEAERRVMLLANPGLDRPSITHTLVAGLQLVMPGEIAGCHRHTQSALRFVLEGNGGYTAVNGERCSMTRGDLILNPSWAWHDHANTGDAPLVWLDGLDVPLTNYLQATFAEEYPTRQTGNSQQTITVADDASLAVYGAGLTPEPLSEDTPVQGGMLRYPYARAAHALSSLARTTAPDPAQGIRLRYTNPANGGEIMPTLAAALQYFPAGFSGVAWRSTRSSVFAAVEGHGRVTIGETSFDWAANDVFVVPNWTWCTFEAEDESTLFSFTDSAALAGLGLLRDEVAS